MIFWKKEGAKIGKIGEREAKNFLKKKGFKIVDVNFQNTRGRKAGEIDIVARKENEIIFVEVKSRLTEDRESLPEENITFKKLKSLQRIARIYLKEKNMADASYHFDAVSVLISPESKKVVKIYHLENIFI
ncbi:MAG: YraN family protein [Candidatus Moranbacteria bacterium]|jgi:putative endonuclease|nr:YraN family protein [Candidatus Moranbacteria bacterium]MDD5652294.1 YraN family protein [Candidatus Moranbacteria bacterium]MDX9855473.1 YraN family protein [Candidatus Moranbacteria bacterium]